MNYEKIKLINQAIMIYKKIYPCGNKRNLFDCFTQIGNSILFWFNTEDHSTHLLKAKIKEE
jgi:hypothetical protein